MVLTCSRQKGIAPTNDADLWAKLQPNANGAGQPNPIAFNAALAQEIGTAVAMRSSALEQVQLRILLRYNVLKISGIGAPEAGGFARFAARPPPYAYELAPETPRV